MLVFEVLGIDNVLFDVGDLDEAHRYYGELFGLPIHLKTPDGGMVLYDLGPETPGLVIRKVEGLEPSPARVSPKIWLEIRDVQAAMKGIEGSGLRPLAPPFEIATGWTVEFADPWGNTMGLTDYTRMPALGRQRSGSPE